MIRVLLVDDDAMVLAGLRAMLCEADTIEIVEAVESGQQAIDHLRCTSAGVVLMDLRMPGMTGIEATREIGKLPQRPKVLVLTTWNTDSMIRDALSAGADGFLLKDASPDELIDAIDRVHDGHTPLAPAVTSRLISVFTEKDSPARRAREDLGRLTEMELEVSRCIAVGMKNADIAAHRYMSVGNVKACVSRILVKLGLDNRVQIATLVNRAE